MDPNEIWALVEEAYFEGWRDGKQAISELKDGEEVAGESAWEASEGWAESGIRAKLKHWGW